MLAPPVGFGLFIAAYVVGRIIHEKALRKLSREQKGQLVETFFRHRLVGLIPMAAIAALYFGMAQFDLSMPVFLSVYVPGMLVFAFVSHVYVFRKLDEIDFDPEFIRGFALSRVVQLVGFALLLLTL